MVEWEKQEGRKFWNPQEKGEEIMGKVVSVDEGDFGKQYTILTGEGKEITTPSHKVLQSRMLKASVGTKARIVYQGTEPAKVRGQNPTVMYEVYFGK